MNTIKNNAVKKSRILLILGDQLDIHGPALRNFNPITDLILMIESVIEAKYVWTHKAKIALFLSAMRHFAEELRELNFPLYYIKESSESIAHTLSKFIVSNDIQSMVCVEPGEWRVQQEIVSLAKGLNLDLKILEDDHFYCSINEFKEWVSNKKELRLEYFYRTMRKKHLILLDSDGNPEGGKWNYDQDNRKSYPKKGPGLISPPAQFSPDMITLEVMKYVEEKFPDHPGSLKHFNWPTTRSQALQALEDFVNFRLENFGIYQDAMWEKTPFGWHSMLSSSLNLKLLNPREVINAVLIAWRKHDLDLSTIEGFIRQILGWREFVRGMYFLDMPSMATDNFYGHSNPLPKWYWTGNTHMNCMKDTIEQTLEYGYAHHIQRLMITGNFALLAEILPKEVSDWYLAIYVDAIEWVELPNTVGMALFANGGRFTSKPYIASGAYVKRMSNYCQSCQYKPDIRFGNTSCPITNLYWNFLINHREQFELSPRTRLMTANLSKISPEDQKQIQAHAKSILKSLDNL